MPALGFIQGPGAWLALAGVTVALLLVDLKLFARGREPTFREGVTWSIGWLAVAMLAALVVAALDGGASAVTYVTVYFIERSLSLDNLFVFLLLFSYFGVPAAERATLLFWGIVAALALRGLAILGGVALIERVHVVTYILGALLLVLAWRILRGVDESVEPDRNLAVRAVRRVAPRARPALLCLAAIVAADIAFAVDSIPAAFAITRDSVLIWMGNIFALLGMRALFVLVEGLIRRFRYLDETIAVVLALVALKLLLEDVYAVGPIRSLLLVAAAFAVGIGASLWADARDPEADAKRAQRGTRTGAGG
jgi:tellurite resistance protein TerC